LARSAQRGQFFTLHLGSEQFVEQMQARTGPDPA
jgi:hypothetical protein